MRYTITKAYKNYKGSNKKPNRSMQQPQNKSRIPAPAKGLDMASNKSNDKLKDI